MTTTPKQKQEEDGERGGGGEVEELLQVPSLSASGGLGTNAAGTVRREAGDSWLVMTMN